MTKIQYGNAEIHIDFSVRNDAAQWRKKQTYPLYFGHASTKVGELIAIWKQDILVGLGILDFGQQEWGLDDFAHRWQSSPRHQDFTRTNQLADALFGGAQAKINAQVTATRFQTDVIKALLDTPFNSTQSYGDIAKQIGRPKAMRPVGGAVGSQPLGIIVPCHRIIGSNGTMTGFYWGLAVKQRLLAYEANF